MRCSRHGTQCVHEGMSIVTVSDPTRKLLWSRAHNACAICKGALTKDADSAELPGLVVGEEAHIVARSEAGPRGRDGARDNIDGYDNVVLLCLEDHKRVDAQPDVFTVDRLRQIKVDHKKWAAERFAGEPYVEPLQLVRQPGEDDIPFWPVTTGAQIWDLVDGVGMRYFSSVQGDVSSDAASASDELLDAANDWSDVTDDVRDRGFAAVRDAQQSLQEMLDEVTRYGLRVFGRRVVRTLVGGIGAPAPWPVAFLTVLTDDDLESWLGASSSE